jgi:DNA (cytosine-5)-methyltransferase 1
MIGGSLPTVSLFSGGGGLDYGLALAGFDVHLAVELEPYACQVLRDAQGLARLLPSGRKYLEGTDIHQGDISELSDEDALRRSGLRSGEAALLAGGPPCVTFSIAGRREGLAGKPGQLYRHYVRLLNAFRPASFIFENVKGMLSSPGGPGDRSAFHAVLRDFEAAGYAVTWKVIDAADYGVPQHRHRVIALGRLGGPPPDFPAPTHVSPQILGISGERPWRTVGEALEGLPPAVHLGQHPTVPNHIARRHSPSVEASFRETPPGRRNTLYKRDKLEWDAPAKTVRAQGKLKSNGTGQRNSSHAAIHPSEPRQLTPRECARLQCFPDWYPLPDDTVNALRIVGDAVPVELARILGNSLAGQLSTPESALTVMAGSLS